jgi:uncharacterized protein
MSKTICIYHANCADGMGAAWAVHRALGADVEFVAAKYGDKPQLSEPCKYHSTCEPCTDCLGTGYELGGGPFLDRDVLIVDFSYPLATLRAMAAEARSVLVIDHHATAEADLVGKVPPVCRGPYSDFLRYATQGVGNLFSLFDLSRSGAGLTWDYLHPGKPRPRIIDLVEDRDLWRFKHDPDTRRSHAGRCEPRLRAGQVRAVEPMAHAHDWK